MAEMTKTKPSAAPKGLDLGELELESFREVQKARDRLASLEQELQAVTVSKARAHEDLEEARKACDELEVQGLLAGSTSPAKELVAWPCSLKGLLVTRAAEFRAPPLLTNERRKRNQIATIK